MVAEYHVHQPVQDHLALWGSQAVDRTWVCADGEDALPSRYGVRADDWVYCL